VGQKTFGIILMSTMIAIGIATISNSINIVLAQFNPNIPFSPSTGQAPTSLSPPSTASPQSPPSPPSSESTSPSDTSRPVGEKSPPAGNNTAPAPGNNTAPAPGNNTAHTGNNTAPVVNSSTIGPPRGPIVIGPSSFTASPINSESQGNVGAPPIVSSNNGTSLGMPGK